VGVRAAVARRVVFPAVAGISRRGFWGRVHGRLAELEQSQWYPAERIREVQLRRVQELVRHAAASVPFYRDRFCSIGLEPGDVTSLDVYATIPPLTRQDVRAHRAALVAEGWSDRVEENATGGSSGEPIRFAVDRTESWSRAAMAIRHNRWAGWSIGDRAGFVWGAPRDLASTGGLKDRVAEACLAPVHLLNAFEITPESVRGFLGRLRRRRAEVLFGYAGSLAEVARVAQAEGERVPSLRTVVSSAEALTPARRRIIEEWSGCPVHDRYGARETGLIASECEERNGLHVAWEDVLVELEPAGLGTSRVLVTKLNSYGMPFLRYDIGDFAQWREGECPCGRQAPRLAMEGCRDTDFLVSADGARVSGSALTLIVRDLPALGTVQLHQATRDEVQVRYAGREALPAPLRAEVRARMQTYLGPVRVTFQAVEAISRAPSGKFQFTVCEVDEARETTAARE
jgi:phenylacetate-CoA ligase